MSSAKTNTKSSNNLPPSSSSIPAATPSLIARIFGINYFIFVLLSGLHACWFLVLPLIPIYYWNVYAAQRLISRILHGYFMLAVGLLEWYGTKIRIFGPPLEPSQIGENALLLCNHPSTADWLFLWSFLHRYGSISALRIVVKKQLHRIPVIGWGLQWATHCFLNRDWNLDKDDVQNLLDHYTFGALPNASTSTSKVLDELNSPPLSQILPPSNFQLLMFPEGTNVCPSTVRRSNEFASKSNLPIRFNVLYPRTTGFVFILNYLRQKRAINAVYDITIAFPGQTKPEKRIEELFAGNFPPSICFHCERIPLNDVPSDDEKAADWLTARYVKKDEMLQRFKEQKDSVFIDDHGKEATEWPVPYSSKLTLGLVVILWYVFSILCMYAFWTSSFVRYWAFVSTLVFVGASFMGGADKIIVDLATRQRQETGSAGSIPPPPPKSKPPVRRSGSKKS